MPDTQLPRVGVTEAQFPLGSHKDWKRGVTVESEDPAQRQPYPIWGSGLQFRLRETEGGRQEYLLAIAFHTGTGWQWQQKGQASCWSQDNKEVGGGHKVCLESHKTSFGFVMSHHY